MTDQAIAVVHFDRRQLAHEFIDAQLQHAAPDQFARRILACAQRYEQSGQIGPRIGLAALRKRLEAMEMNRASRSFEDHVVKHRPAFRPFGIGDQQPEGPFTNGQRIGR